MAVEKHFDLGHDNVVAASAIMKDAHLIVQLAVAINTHRNAHPMFSEELHDLLIKMRCVGRQTELNALANLGALGFGVAHGTAEERKIQQRLAAKKSDVN